MDHLEGHHLALVVEVVPDEEGAHRHPHLLVGPLHTHVPPQHTITNVIAKMYAAIPSRLRCENRSQKDRSTLQICKLQLCSKKLFDVFVVYPVFETKKVHTHC